MTSVIKKNGFFFGYVAALIGAYGLDCLTTYYALSQGLGYEMNPLVNTTNFFTIFFEPFAMMVFGVTITIVYLAEKKRRNEINSNSAMFFVLLFTSFICIFSSIIATVNNTIVILSGFAPVGEFTRLLPNFSDYPSLSLFLQLTVFYFIETVIFIWIAWTPVLRRYNIDSSEFYWFRKPKQTQS